MKSSRKYHYDEQEGVFVFDDEISINWLVSQVLNIPNLQITKISNEQVQSLLSTLSKSDLRLPNGQHSLHWLRQQVKDKMTLAESKLSEAWHQTATRYKYIIEQIDHVIIESKDIIEHGQYEKVEVKRDSNNMQAYFEPL